MESPDSYVLAAEKETINQQVIAAWQDHTLIPDPTLARYFSQSCKAIQAKTIDFKNLWLRAIQPNSQTLTQLPTNINQDRIYLSAY